MGSDAENPQEGELMTPTDAQTKANQILARLAATYSSDHYDTWAEQEAACKADATIIAAALTEAYAQGRRDTLTEIEKLADLNCAGKAIDEYGVGYQNAMKEISVHCELTRRAQAAQEGKT